MDEWEGQSIILLKGVRGINMNFVSSKNAFVTTLFLVAAGHAGSALAHTQIGSLGVGPRLTDHYQVTCSTAAGGATARLEMRVKDNTAGTTQVSVQIRKGSIAFNTTDPIGGDAAYSIPLHVYGGSGAYNVLVDKTAIGFKSYTLDYHCQTSTGVHTGTSIIMLQNW